MAHPLVEQNVIHAQNVGKNCSFKWACRTYNIRRDVHLFCTESSSIYEDVDDTVRTPAEKREKRTYIVPLLNTVYVIKLRSESKEGKVEVERDEDEEENWEDDARLDVHPDGDLLRRHAAELDHGRREVKVKGAK
jgi:hypothetical protein